MATVTGRHRERAREWLDKFVDASLHDDAAQMDSLAALLAEVESKTEKAERALALKDILSDTAILQSRIAALEAALRGLKSVLGPSAPTCDGCSEEIAEALVQVDTALSGSDSALKPLLVRAARAGCESAYEDASSYCQEDDDGRRKWAEAIAERVIRGE